MMDVPLPKAEGAKAAALLSAARIRVAVNFIVEYLLVCIC